MDSFDKVRAKDNLKYSYKIFKRGSDIVRNMGDYKVNRKLFPLCLYSFKTLNNDNSQNRNDIDLTYRSFLMQRRGHIDNYINHNIENIESMEKLGNLMGCDLLIDSARDIRNALHCQAIAEINQLIESEKIDRDLYKAPLYSFLNVWKELSNEEEIASKHFDEIANEFYKDIFDVYQNEYSNAMENFESFSPKEQKAITRLAPPNNFFVWGMNNEVLDENFETKPGEEDLFEQ